MYNYDKTITVHRPESGDYCVVEYYDGDGRRKIIYEGHEQWGELAQALADLRGYSVKIKEVPDEEFQEKW